ncbi:helix-turn-helix domain-containing protein [Aliiroseovarius sp.]|uniref:helix-turn-helix domain-containing protein n=1 Tax=Aliiroseovarius sp. TaxID=1872442 RepID=UPI003BAB2C4A
MPSFDKIRSVERTIAVLRAMNGQNLSRISDLQQKTGLPAATVVRIVETLVSLGLVQNHGRRVGYTLTEKVLELSAGYHGLPLFLEHAKEVLLELTGAIKWPAALATLGDTAMVVRLSTIPESPLAHTHSTLQKRLDLLVRAHGRAFLAHCPQEERMQLYKRLREEEMTLLSPDELDARMRPILAQVHHLGYAERDHEIDPQTTTVAMPVFIHGHLNATIGVTFFRGARADRNDILHQMRQAVERLEALA